MIPKNMRTLIYILALFVIYPPKDGIAVNKVKQLSETNPKIVFKSSSALLLEQIEKENQVLIDNTEILTNQQKTIKSLLNENIQ